MCSLFNHCYDDETHELISVMQSYYIMSLYKPLHIVKTFYLDDLLTSVTSFVKALFTKSWQISDRTVLIYETRK